MHYNQKNKQTGFTVIELMITILVGGILMAIALPGFRGMQRSNCMTTTTNQMIVSLNLARSEAAKFNDSINITAFTNTATNEWGTGWTVWRDLDSDSTEDSGEAIYSTTIDCGTLTVDDTNDDNEYVYRSDGFIDSATSIEICDPTDTGAVGRQIQVSVTGRPSVNSQFDCS